MAVFVLVHGAWHGAWAWERVVPLLSGAGAQVVVPELTADVDAGLGTHVEEVLLALDALPTGETAVLVGHSYAGLVVRQAADRRPWRVRRLVLVDGWAGPSGASLVGLAPDWFGEFLLGSAQDGDDRVPAPGPAAFGIEDPVTAGWLGERLRPQPVRTFTEPTRLTGAVDRIPGTAICCHPAVFEFAAMGRRLGYRLRVVDGPHDVMLTAPERLAAEIVGSG